MKRFVLIGAMAFAAASWAAGPETSEWQAKIDAASAAGGGRVVVPAGVHPVAELELKSNVTLELAEGARLTAIHDYSLYRWQEGLKAELQRTGVLVAYGATNIALVGKGVIDGGGDREPKSTKRPVRWRNVYFEDCRDVKILGLTMENSSFWTCFLRRCDGVHVKGLTIRATSNYNNDGLDLCVSNALIEDCDIISEDDAIVMKNFDPDWASEKVEIRNCKLSSNATYIKFGTETFGVLKDFDIHDCELVARSASFWRNNIGKAWWPGLVDPRHGTCGLMFLTVDGGVLENVRVRDIAMKKGVCVPFVFRLGRRHGRECWSRTAMRNVTLERIRMDETAFSAVGAFMSGVPGLDISDVTIRDSSFKMQALKTPLDWQNLFFKEYESTSPGAGIFKSPMPAHFLYSRHAQNVRLENVTVEVDGTGETRPAVVTDDAGSVTLKGCAFGVTERMPKASAAKEPWEDESRLAENRLPPRAWFGSFPDVASARKIRPELSPRRLCLDSETDWRFAWSRRPSERPVGFEQPDYDVSSWAVVKVPCSWQAAGIRKSGERFGTPIYVNQPYVFTEKFPADKTCYPRVTGLPVGKGWTFGSADNPVGSYRRDFIVPADWIGDDLFLQFDGVETFFCVWVNGKYVGFSKNSRSPAAFDVTKFVRAGRNTVAVEVYRHSDGSYLECQDMFRLSGIIRSVGLTHRPKDRLADVKFTTRPARAGVYDGDWILDLAVQTVGTGKVTARAFDADGREIAVRVGETVFARPKLWSAEEPNLYTLVVSVERDGKCREAAGFQLGFRQVEIREAADPRDRTFLFNGQPVKLKGVNRGETDPRYGHHVPDARIEEDLRLVKRGNFNHIRCSHFPQPGYFYYLCNRLGIYVMDEANLESHGTKYGAESLSNAKNWEAAHVERQASMYEWNKNFPCIVIWSMGNEAGPGDAFKACYRYLKEKDPTRPVQYERNPWLTDLGSRQYPAVEWVQRCAAGDPTMTDNIQTNRPVHYPYHINEYAHNFNNACGNLADFQEAIESSTRIMGGAIWDWANQALEMNCRGKRVLAWGGCFGEKPEEGQGILDGIVTADRTPEPCYYEAQHVFQNFAARLKDGKVALTNKNYFRDSSGYICRWTLLRNGEQTETGTFDVLLRPQQTRLVDLPEAVRAACARCDAEIALRVEFVLKKAEGVWPQGWIAAADQLALADWKGRPSIGTETVQYVFSKESGELVSVRKGGRELLKAPVTLDCFRVPVGGETTYREGRMYFGRERLLDGLRTMRPTLKSFVDRTDAQGARHVRSVIAYRGARKEDMPRYGHVNEMEIDDLGPLADDSPGLEATSDWTIAADGSAQVKTTFVPFGRPTEFSRVGWRFVFAAPKTRVDYFACGPHDNYSDRKSGSFAARYSALSTDFGFGGDVTQDAGNREEARYVELAEPGLAFTSTGSRRFAFQVSPYSTTELLRCPHPELLPAPSKTELGVYARVRGLGSANCGPKPLDRDIIAAGEVCTLEFAISPRVNALERSLCVVHRGWGLLMPENSIPALEKCWEAGFLPECDARVTTDGVIYAFHDPAYKGRPMKEFSWKEVQQIDIGEKKGPVWRGKGVRAPTWEAIFAAMAGRPERTVLMDHKDAPVEALAALVRKYGVEKQAWWCSGTLAGSNRWKKLVPDGKALAWVRFGKSWKKVDFNDAARLKEIDDYVAKCIDEWESQDFGEADVIEPIVNVDISDFSRTSPSLSVIRDAVRRIRAKGKKSCVLIWSEGADHLESYRLINDAAAPDSLGTDYPARLQEFIHGSAVGW